jgi:flavin reductase (DIM6/NTAB) family NADH-FMN oxidoreductase RutF
MVTPDDFKQVMRRWASTVNIVTTRTDDLIYGLTVTSFSSLAVNPPLVFVCVNKNARTHAYIEKSGIFCVNFLTPDMSHLSDRFAGRLPDEERFRDVAYHVESTGSPVLDGAVAFLDCTVDHSFVSGDHTIFVGAVQAGGVQHLDDTPLLYFNGQYRLLGDALQR